MERALCTNFQIEEQLNKQACTALDFTFNQHFRNDIHNKLAKKESSEVIQVFGDDNSPNSMSGEELNEKDLVNLDDLA